MLDRRIVIAAPAALLALSAGRALAAGVPADMVAGDMSLGNPKAPVHVVEYASLSCPHCAHFNAEVFPQLKAKYVDAGRVYFTLKEYLTDPAIVAAAGFLIARCGGRAGYFPIVDGIFRSQPEWRTGAIKPILLKVAAEHGVSADRANACLGDDKAVQALDARVKQALDVDKVESTPTVRVNGQTVDAASGELSFADMEAAIARASAPKGRGS